MSLLSTTANNQAMPLPTTATNIQATAVLTTAAAATDSSVAASRATTTKQSSQVPLAITTDALILNEATPLPGSVVSNNENRSPSTITSNHHYQLDGVQLSSHRTVSSSNVPIISNSNITRAPPLPQRASHAAPAITFPTATTLDPSVRATPYSQISRIPNQPTLRSSSSSMHTRQPNVVPNSITSSLNTVSHTVTTHNQPVVLPCLSVAPPSMPLKWFYLTRFQPHETTENIVSFVSSKTKCDPSSINCIKLVRENRNNNIPLTYISFKLSVPSVIEALITSPHFWPAGISINPFFYPEHVE